MRHQQKFSSSLIVTMLAIIIFLFMTASISFSSSQMIPSKMTQDQVSSPLIINRTNLSENKIHSFYSDFATIQQFSNDASNNSGFVQPINVGINKFSLDPRENFYFKLSVTASPIIILSYQLQSSKSVIIYLLTELSFLNWTSITTDTLEPPDDPIFVETVNNSKYSRQLPTENLAQGIYYLVLYNDPNLNSFETIQFESVSLLASAYYIEPKSQPPYFTESAGGHVITSEMVTSSISSIPSLILTIFMISAISLIVFLFILVINWFKKKKKEFTHFSSGYPPYSPYSSSSLTSTTPPQTSIPVMRNNQHRHGQHPPQKVKKLENARFPQVKPITSTQCPECGGMIQADDIFCMFCGAKLK